jgi:ATP-binding protein involved in chromosome partitioning
MDIKQILQALEGVLDPQTGRDIVAMQMVKDLRIEGDQVFFTLILPSLAMKGKTELNFACMAAIMDAYPQAQVHVHFMADASMGKTVSAVPHIKNIIAIASGKGGVGKSTVSVNLALAMKQLGARVGIMDADVYGPSLPTMFNIVQERPMMRDVTGQPKIVPIEAFGIPVISIGNMIEPDQAVVLRGPRLAAIIKQFFNDVLWDELDYLIVDLPPGTGDVQLSLVQTAPITGVVLVTTPQQVAVADAIKAMNMFLLPQINVPILGVVENMAWFTPAELPDNKYFIFGEGGGKQLAKLSNTMLLGQVPLVQSVREGGDMGLPVVMQTDNPAATYFVKIAENVMRQVAIRNEMIEPTQIVKMEG